MTTIVHVRVTQEDIDYGIGGNAHQCPIARAATRTMGRSIRISYDCILDYRHGVIGVLPPEAQDFVASFDNGDSDIVPFEFDVVIDEY